MSAARAAVPVTLLALVPLAGCVRWEALTDGDEIVLADFLVRGDSLYGTETRDRRPQCAFDQLAACDVRMVLAEVQYVDVRRLDGWRTAAIVLVPVGVFVVVLIEDLACSEAPFSSPEPRC